MRTRLRTAVTATILMLVTTVGGAVAGTAPAFAGDVTVYGYGLAFSEREAKDKAYADAARRCQNEWDGYLTSFGSTADFTPDGLWSARGVGNCRF